MKTYFYNKYSNKDLIYKDDFICDLCTIWGFDIYESSMVFNYITNRHNTKTEAEIKDIISNRTKGDYRKFIEFIGDLSTVLMPNKLYTEIIEDSYIALIENVVSQTNGHIIFSSQLDIVYQTIGRTFMWSDLDKKNLIKPDDIRDYFSDNMRDYSNQYDKLFSKLISVVDIIDLESNDDLFISMPTKSRFAINVAREQKRQLYLENKKA